MKKRKKKVKEETEEEEGCPYCGSLFIVDDEAAEGAICQSCGRYL